ncbi:hypothetical protein H0H87_002934, partial [Tephrocybe sp. NHM501043]
GDRKISSTHSAEGMFIGSTDRFRANFLIVDELLLGWREMAASTTIDDDTSRGRCSMGFVAMTGGDGECNIDKIVIKRIDGQAGEQCKVFII